MPWEETCVVEERLKFVMAWARGEASFSELCRQFAISRKTAYKWRGRYEAGGIGGLNDRSKAPVSCPHRMGLEVEAAVLELRHTHPTWGPKKLRARLAAVTPDGLWPAPSTIGALLERQGLVHRRKLRQRTPPHTAPFAHCDGANDVWCADFKGWFRTGNRACCEPFTLSDAATRYLLRVQAIRRHDVGHVWPLFDAAFREYGLPKALRSDNGPPFASTGAGGLSPLAVRLVKAGVVPERIEPGRPDQNGRHERMHLTLSQDTASPPAATLGGQARRFARFRHTFNEERPHEALGLVPPASLYRPSARVWSGRLNSPDYGGGVAVRRVRRCGEIRWRGARVYISETLAGEPVGLDETDAGRWTVMFGPVMLGTLDAGGVFRKPARRKCRTQGRGFVDNAKALPTTPQPQQRQ